MRVSSTKAQNRQSMDVALLLWPWDVDQARISISSVKVIRRISRLRLLHPRRCLLVRRHPRRTIQQAWWKYAAVSSPASRSRDVAKPLEPRVCPRSENGRVAEIESKLSRGHAQERNWEKFACDVYKTCLKVACLCAKKASTCEIKREVKRAAADWKN